MKYIREQRKVFIPMQVSWFYGVPKINNGKILNFDFMPNISWMISVNCKDAIEFLIQCKKKLTLSYTSAVYGFVWREWENELTFMYAYACRHFEFKCTDTWDWSMFLIIIHEQIYCASIDWFSQFILKKVENQNAQPAKMRCEWMTWHVKYSNIHRHYSERKWILIWINLISGDFFSDNSSNFSVGLYPVSVK